MGRISLDVDDEVHNRLKALAALQGDSLKDFMLKRALGDKIQDDDRALAELTAFLDVRIQRSEKEGASKRSVEEIFQQAYREAESGQNG